MAELTFRELKLALNDKDWIICHAKRSRKLSLGVHLKDYKTNQKTSNPAAALSND